MSYDLTRRKLLGAASTGLLAARVAQPASTGKPAILGGRPVRTTPFPSWPVVAETIGIVNAEKMTQARVLLSRFAQEHGGEYDSWETALK